MSEEKKQQFTDAVFENINIILKICNIYASEPNKEDLKQEIIYQLWKSYPSFKGKSKFQTWMYRVALNTAMLSLRKKRIDISDIDPEAYSVAEENSNEAEIQSNVNILYKYIATFNDLDKAVIFLYMEKCTYKEIAEVTGISEKNVSVKLVRIKEKLRSLFNDKND
jgi:RNA polymerase sigma-70 factor (ECF subfamily)